MRDETLGDVVRDTLAKDEAKTIGDTHGEVKTNSLLDALLYLLAQVVNTVVVTLA